VAAAQAVSRYSLSVAPDFARSTERVGSALGGSEPAPSQPPFAPPDLPNPDGSRSSTSGPPEGGHRGTIFLTDPRTRLVIWSTLGLAKDTRPTGSRSTAHCQPALVPALARTGRQVPTKSRGSPASQRKTPAFGRTAGRLSRRKAWVRGSGRRGAPNRPPRGRTLARSKKPLNRALNGSGDPTPHRIAAWGEIFKTNRTP
jgi:hypothetical protein